MTARQVRHHLGGQQAQQTTSLGLSQSRTSLQLLLAQAGESLLHLRVVVEVEGPGGVEEALHSLQGGDVTQCRVPVLQQGEHQVVGSVAPQLALTGNKN